MPIELTVRDTETGDQDSCVIGDGPAGYVVTCGPGCYLANEQVHANGTVQLTIKPIPVDEPPPPVDSTDGPQAECDEYGVRHTTDPSRCNPAGPCRPCPGCPRCGPSSIPPGRRPSPRDPGFYGATYCIHCGKHLPVAEFVWTADGTVVGS